MPPKARKRIKDKATAKGDASSSQNGKKSKSEGASDSSSGSFTKFIVLLVVAAIVGFAVAVQLGYVDIKQLQDLNGASDPETAESQKPIVTETDDRIARDIPDDKVKEGKSKDDELKKEKAPEPKKEKAPEPKKEKAPEPKKERAPEPKKEKAPEPKKEKAPEPKKEKAPEPKKEKAPEPKKEKAPEPKKEKAPEPKKEKAPEPKKEKAPEPKKEKAPEPKKEKAPEPKKEKAPEPKKEKAPEPKKETAPEPKKEKSPEPKKEKAPEPKKEKAPEPKKEKAPEPKKEKAPEPKKEKAPEPKKEKAPEPKKEKAPEPKKEKAPEPKKEKAPEPKKEKAPEPKKEKAPEPKKEKAPEPKKEKAPEPKKEKAPEPKKEKAPETKDQVKDPKVKENEPSNKRQKKNKEEVIVEGRTNSYDKNIEKELIVAEDLLSEKKLESALRRFEKLLTTHPASPRARLGRANSLKAIAEDQRSNDLLKACINAFEETAKAPNCPKEILKEALIAQADRLKFLGNSMQAVKVLEDLNRRIPDDVDVLRELGVVYLIKGNNQASKPVFKKILEILPKDGHAMVHLGFILKSETNYEESIPLLFGGIATGDEGTNEGKYYFHLGDALYRIGKVDEAYDVYNTAAVKGFFLSKWQRSLYNVDSLTAKPWWTPESAQVEKFVKLLEDNWQVIRDEGVANMDPKTGAFVPEVENLRETGDWKQFTLYRQGKRSENCKRAPKTCEIIDQIPAATSNKRGQVKFSVLHPDTHIWAHCGPTNCRLRGHLGLVVPDGVRIRVKDESRTWQEGKMLIFDDSFEHEVWHEGSRFRLILIVDFWHPELTESQKRKLTAI